MATKFNVKHQGKVYHHPPSTIHKLLLSDLPGSTPCPSLSLSFTIKNLLVGDFFGYCENFREGSLTAPHLDDGPAGHPAAAGLLQLKLGGPHQPRLDVPVPAPEKLIRAANDPSVFTITEK